MSGVHYLNPRLLASGEPLLDDTLMRRLIDVYFDDLNPIFSPISESEFRLQLKSRASEVESSTPETRLFDATCHVICATSMRYLEVTQDEQFEVDLEERLFDDAYQTVAGLGFEWQSIEIIQGWLLIVFYLRMCHRHMSAWNALGRAVTMCTGMYLCEQHGDKSEERVFWSCYTWDRLLSLESGRPFGFRDEDVTLVRPAQYEDDGWMSIVSYGLLRLAYVVSLYSPSPGFGFERRVFDPVKKKAMLEALERWTVEMSSMGLGSDENVTFEGVKPAVYAFLRQQYHSVVYIFHVETLLQFSAGGTIKYDGVGGTNELLSSAHGLLKLSMAMKRAKCLVSPLWLTLSTLFNTGCLLICFANVGIDWTNSAHSLGNVVALVTDLQLSGKFTMAAEVLWVLKTLNHAVFLRLQRTQMVLRAVGIDHGSRVVNNGRLTGAKIGHQAKLMSMTPPQDMVVDDHDWLAGFDWEEQMVLL